ncbi:MAG: hypothetical protein G01um101429_1033 [Parcubacteria group bacterium Gr01-1014_29]|nr:MAG: hypothetical protein G01um101429_1033 [Parcubacteria group bacterium Gr01-1014_29]
MSYQNHIILVGDPHVLDEFSLSLRRAGVAVTSVEKVSAVMAAAEKIKPDAIVCILPRYWDDITVFVDEFRKKPGFEDTPILYVGSLVEGEDQRILQQKGVKTLTLGPLPPQEVVRYILNMLKS